MIDINLEYSGMTFDDCVGHVAKALNKVDTVPQVVLFAGPYGCGKNLFAYLLAHKLPNPDVSVRGTADNTAATAESIIAQFSEPPMLPNVQQVCILNEFSLFRKDAQGKFKDIFQAPPARTYFFLTSMEPERVLPDVKNRMRLKVSVTKLTPTESYDLVCKVCDREEVDIPKKMKLRLAELSNGIPRTITYAVKTLKSWDDPTIVTIENIVQDIGQERSESDQQFYRMWMGLRGAAPATMQGIKDTLAILEPEGIRFKMLNMVYKSFNSFDDRFERFIFEVMTPPLSVGAEKFDILVRLIKIHEQFGRFV